MINKLLKFSIGSAKLNSSIGIFDIPAGHTCIFAKKCLSCANRLTGKIKDGKEADFRCYAAMTECTYPAVRAKRWYNFDLLKKCKSVTEMAQLINDSLPGTNIIRIHSSGEYYSLKYFLAWLNVAKNNPHIIFYSYTKALPFWVQYRNEIPNNFVLTASYGGTNDDLIEQYNLKSVRVVFSIEEANNYNLEIDHDDSHAIYGTKSFLLYLHGSQPAKSFASKSLSILKKNGIFGYTKNRKIKIDNKTIKIAVGETV